MCRRCAAGMGARRDSKPWVRTDPRPWELKPGDDLQTKLNRIALASHDEFLKDHDLYNEFYCPSDEEMGE